MDYITLSDLMQIMIAFSTTGAFIVALAAFLHKINNKKK